ncbi:MAG: hypothetical protein JKX81_02945 [Arenicella sp.]|nr:hypothetical protein [Arenicella sp.]
MLERRQAQTQESEASFDDLMASLFVLVTHHSLTQCEASLDPIVERLNILCQHSEIEHYPNQLKVLAKMRQLWRTKLFNAEYSGLKH